MKNFLNKQREIIALLAYVAIIAGLVYGVILPLLARINDMNDQIQQESMKQESVKLHISELPKIQEQYHTLQSGGDLTDALLDKNRAVILIEKLEKLAESTNNEITIAVQEKENVAAKKTPAKSTAPPADTLVAGLPSSDYLQMKITLTGDYGSIIRFISLLEKFEYYADIAAVQISKDETSAKLEHPASNAGTFGVIAPSVANVQKIIPTVSEKNILKASLDTVFYTN